MIRRSIMVACLRHPTRGHNDANELTSLDPDGSGGGAASALTHDKAGNIVSKYVSYADADNYKKYTYVHDAWNRLVQIAYEEMVDGDGLTPIQVADYRYNGLTWRITKKADTSLPTVDGLDEMHVYIYSAGWQLLEDRIDTGWGGSGFTADKIQQVIYGIRYIDDVVCRRVDGNADGDYVDSGDGDKTYYHLTDQQFSTVAILDENAALLERVSYDAYGRARHHRRCDFTGDGATNNSDLGAVIANWGNSGVADSNRDGTVNSTDQLAVIGDWVISGQFHIPRCASRCSRAESGGTAGPTRAE